MNVLLIYPEFPDTFWSFRHALKFVNKKSAFPPLGLLTISSMLPKAWNRRLVDMNVRTLTTADLEWADVVFASAMYVQKESLKEVISLCKTQGKTVVMGGPYASMGLNDAIEADHVFVGDNFIGNKKNVRLLMPELAEWSARNKYPFAFTTEASVNLADDDELLAQMRTAGFRQVFIGIETPVVESLKEAQKGQNTRRDLIG